MTQDKLNKHTITQAQIIVEETVVKKFKLNKPHIIVSSEGNNEISVYLAPFNVLKNYEFDQLVKFLVEVNEKLNPPSK